MKLETYKLTSLNHSSIIVNREQEFVTIYNSNLKPETIHVEDVNSFSFADIRCNAEVGGPYWTEMLRRIRPLITVIINTN